ncbi:nucleoside triphosphate pyrophosphohydrolase [Aquibacillus kalidii]|uniref:nucleoside triphosphate pyrophosphohydrolase n=1 Tax=Aquibacillus kalidii TaxID=2762597 RepID=UPI0016473AE1|nr:nucleoside triphosphate pyrophosphohydrolase [Aquibacillus kalidii]
MPVFNKLVRDRIPEIIDQTGKTYKTRKLAHEEYITALQSKLQEEALEYLEADNDVESLEELADILEILHALAKTHDASIEKVEEIRKQKAAERGGFDEKVFLVEVDV